MEAIRSVLAAIRRADQTFNLIQPGDRIVLGVSGGKDSLLLTYALTLYGKFAHTDFTLYPVILDLGFPGFDPSPLYPFMEDLGLTLTVSDARTVYPILEANKAKDHHLPCSICSRMKKAAINKVAKELGCNKVAFAHHADDAVETLFMNEIFGGRIATFEPKMTLERADVVFIRPLIFVRENEIIKAAKELDLPVRPSPCPADRHTMRQEVKEMLHDIYQKHPFAKANFLTMLTNYEREGVWFKALAYQIEGTDLSVRPVRDKETTLAMMAIRFRVFIDEQRVDYAEEFDGSDDDAFNFLIYKKDIPVGTIRYIAEDHRTFRIGRFCVLSEFRGQNIGKALFVFLEDYLRERYTPCEIYFHAQTAVRGFYEKLGYVPEGDIFYEANIPHITMRKKDL